MSVLYILQILLMFTVLVAAHELGHFLVAKFYKMEVEEFSIGLGLPKWIYARRNGTEYSLRMLPLGGFVRVKGMEPEDDGSEVEIPNGFYNKGPMPRVWMLLAGPAFSMLAGAILLTGVWGFAGKTELDTRPIIHTMAENGPAAAAGMKENDKVVSIDGTPTPNFFSIIELVRDNKGTPMTLVIERGGQQQTIIATPEVDKEPTEVLNSKLEPTKDRRIQGKLKIGIELIRVPVPFGLAIKDAFTAPFLMVGELVKRLSDFSKLKEVIGGPETMARTSYAAAERGPVYLIELAGLISMSLGIFNLLPIFPLDGGQITIALAELFRRGRRLSIGAQGRIQTIGLCTVLLLVTSVVIIDRQRDWGGAAKKAPASKPAEQK